jgi:DNA primase
MSDLVQKIKEKIDIVSFIGAYVKLDKTGANYKGKCPFHNEKTPSFFVSPERGSFYCFGCHKKGDIFNFVEEFDGLDFMGALKILADKAGLDIKELSKNNNEKTEKELAISVMELACFYFELNLSNEKIAKDYLLARGLTENSIKNWRIGFAKDEWRGLYDFLLSKNIKKEDMLKCGLIKQKEGTDSFYDTFRGRIMFPIFDPGGRVVAFSGRILVNDNKIAKYLNSPETILFSKSDILYGLDKAKQSIRERDYSILVEGQMDILMLHQVGFTNTIASSGTALTENHLTRLQRLSNNIIFAFDGDSAGFNAIERSAKIALSLGMEVKVSKMPEGSDPADLSLKDKELLKEVIKNSKNIIYFLLDDLLEKDKDPRVISKKIVSNILPFVAMVKTSSEKSHFITYISQKTGLKEQVLSDDLRTVNLQEKGVSIAGDIKLDKNKEEINFVSRKIIGILWREIDREQRNQKTIINIERLKKKLDEILGFNILNDLFKKLEPERNSLLFETDLYYNDNSRLDSEVEDLLKSLILINLQKKADNMQLEIRKKELLRDDVAVNSLLKEFGEILRQINEIKNPKK